MKSLSFLISAFLLSSCAALPAIQEPSADQTKKPITCPSPFLTEKTRFIHAIDVQTAGKTKTVMIGVTVADPARRTFSCAIMSTEGMVVFEAVSGNEGVNVIRALPPFDAPDFARNMMDDMELIFLEPAGVLAGKGVFAGGEVVCRRRKDQDGWIDVVAGHDGRTQIRRYSECGALERTVNLNGNSPDAYKTIELQSAGLMGYSLMMTLIESEVVKDIPATQK
ncbi:MAG: hypothetical protein CVU51_13940 [Deltaproteobacteria bacterium HGW-Deltaproteobacteria-1]|jgi:hypothetical protein|nr:MAG: hypothetical protein CVU51_13940 [Deltaproteobacteria bacterium HGW-Deltaproteobacteria-1]